jgi:hypothetical protein
MTQKRRNLRYAIFGHDSINSTRSTKAIALETDFGTTSDILREALRKKGKGAAVNAAPLVRIGQGGYISVLWTH